MLYFVCTIALVLIDQGIKIVVRQQLSPSDLIELIPNFIHLTYQENRGISFSFLSELPEGFRQPALAGVSLAVITGLLIYLWRNWIKIVKVERIGFCLILAGAIGNLIDRAFRGSVTDYMYFHFYDTSFFVNNFADDLISFGFVALLYHSFKRTDGL